MYRRNAAKEKLIRRDEERRGGHTPNAQNGAAIAQSVTALSICFDEHVAPHISADRLTKIGASRVSWLSSRTA
jgi:hypothetical protein